MLLAPPPTMNERSMKKNDRQLKTDGNRVLSECRTLPIPSPQPSPSGRGRTIWHCFVHSVRTSFRLTLENHSSCLAEHANRRHRARARANSRLGQLLPPAKDGSLSTNWTEQNPA